MLREKLDDPESPGIHAGVFLLGAMLWSWALDGMRPDRFDTIGATLVLAGITTILWGRALYS